MGLGAGAIYKPLAPPHPTVADLTQILMNSKAVADVDTDSDIALTDIALIAKSLAKTGIIANV